MARKAAKIHKEASYKNTKWELSIFDKCWIVLYDGKPARIRYNQPSGANKYTPLYFTEQARAINRCNLLNTQFNTELFTVKEVEY